MQRIIYHILFLFLILCGCAKQDSVSVAKTELGKFYNYSTVDWALIDTLYYRPYNCDWPEEIEAQMHPDFPSEEACTYWHLLQNAKTYMHQQTLPLQSGASDAFLQQLGHTEATLDSVFVRIVSQEYYMRLFVDCYEELMPQEIDKCFQTIEK